MKHFISLYLVTVLLAFNLAGQNGFQLSIKDNFSNIISSTILSNDTFYNHHLSVKDLNYGFIVNTSCLDSNFNSVNYFVSPQSIYSNAVSKTGNMICESLDQKYIITVPTTYNGEMVFQMFDKINKLNIKNNLLKYRAGKNDFCRTRKILAVNDGYILVGELQKEDDFSGYVLSIVKVDLEGNVIYWKLIGSHTNANDFGDATLTSDGFLLISGTTNGLNERSFLLKINAENGNVIRDVSLSEGKDKVTSFGIKEREGKVYIVGIHSNQPFIYKPGLMIYNNALQLEKYTYLDIENTAKWYPYFNQFSYPNDLNESTTPYQSTLDKEGNIYVVTKGFFYFDQELIDENLDEYISITKFNPEGDIIWETVDTIDNKMLGCNNKFIYPKIGSVNVSNSGSIYITGYYRDSDKIFYIDTNYFQIPYAYYDSIAMKDTFAYKDTMTIDTIIDIQRFVGFAMKYNKDGCLVQGCKLPDSTSDVTESKHEDLTIYPNPTSENIKILNNKSTLEYSIYDQLGVKMDYGNALNEIDVKMLNSGIYCLYLKSKNGINHAFKFIKL